MVLTIGSNTFTHAQLGDLGRLRITPHGPAQTLASAEIAPGDPDAPDWERKYHLLDQVDYPRIAQRDVTRSKAA